MDNQRLLPWAFFGLMAFFTWQQWAQDYAPRPVAPPEQAPAAAAPSTAMPAVDDATIPAIAEQAPATATEMTIESPDAAPATEATVRVSTDVLDVEISTRGGTLTKAWTKKYPVAKDRPDVYVQLLDTAGPNYGAIESGVRATGGAAEATHLTVFNHERAQYELGDAEELEVPLTWTDASGVVIEKRFRFRRGSYTIDLEQDVRNGSPNDWAGAEYVRIKRHSAEPERSMFDVDSYSFSGPIVYNGEKSEKLDRDDLLSDGKFEFYATRGWFGSIQHHFVRAVVPPPEGEYKYEVSVSGDVATSSAIGRAASAVPAGQSRVFSTTLFVGPKLQSQLEKIDDSLKLTVDYGWLTIISQPMFWLLSFIYDYVANWGVTIIVVTFLIKLAFYKLTEASGRSMAKMRNLQPRMKALQDRYKDDRPALSQAMMDLYKREKVNPAAGCLPILIQMPFFLAFYWVLLESVEMRQAPFMLWITDLSTRDPYFILPLIMGAGMFLQQKLNPAPTDPVQAKVMQVMPVLFTAMFAFFPSGLVLYWVTNTLLSIAQQWKINKVVEAEAKSHKGGKKPA
ncbi:MAG TPA: membrane protein insertase YidC [Woeseiaceae bacterium]